MLELHPFLYANSSLMPPTSPHQTIRKFTTPVQCSKPKRYLFTIDVPSIYDHNKGFTLKKKTRNSMGNKMIDSLCSLTVMRKPTNNDQI